jgi:hypothetical protein
MLELLGVLIAVGATAFGYLRSRSFVASRLRFVDAVQHPIAPFVAGGAALLIAAPVTWLLPVVGGGTALLFGGAVGLGTRAGVRRIRQALPAQY